MLNINLRTVFLKRLFKLMKNRVFGKTLENSKRPEGMKPMTSQGKYTTYVIKSNFKDGYLLLGELYAIEIGKTEIKMDKPVS